MKTFKLLVFLVCVGFVISLIPGSSHCEGGGESGRPIVYRGKARFEADSSNFCEFNISIERVTFMLLTFENKYRVIRIQVLNKSANSIQLSSENDSIVLKRLGIGKEDVRGLFKLQEQDAPLWDSLGPQMRETLAYPQIIRAGRDSNTTGYSPLEIMYIYAFFPKDKITRLPWSFCYKIDSLPEPIEIIQPPRTMK